MVAASESRSYRQERHIRRLVTEPRAMLLHSRRHRQRGANRWRLQELPQRQCLTRIVGSTTDAAPDHSTKPAARTLSASTSDRSGPQFGDDAAQEGKACLLA